MTVPVLSNRAGESSVTTGTGTITLAGALSDIYFTFAESGITDSQVVGYLIKDIASNDVEVGYGTYTASGTTLSRDTVLISKISGTQGTTKITLSSQSEAYVIIPSENIVAADSSTGDIDLITGSLTTGGSIIIDVDGTAIGADGAITFGAGPDGAIYSDGTNFLIDAAAAHDFRIAGTTIGDWDVGGLNLVAGDTFQINDTDVVTATTLPAALSANAMTSASSLVTVSALASGSIASGFGTIVTAADITGLTINPTGDTSAADIAAIGNTATDGLVLTGQGDTNDVTVRNDDGDTVIRVPTGTTGVVFAGDTDVSSGTVTGPSGSWAATGMDLATTDSYFIDGNNVLSQTTLGSTVVSSSLESVGTISTGTWEGTEVAVGQGGTGATSLTDGGILLGSDTSAITPMAVLGDGAIVVGDGATDPVAMTAFTSSTGDLLPAKGGTIGQQTIYITATSMVAAITTAPASLNSVEISTSLFASVTMDFAADADDFAYFQIQMPESWNAGTLICQFVWSTTGAQTGGLDGVAWSLAANHVASDAPLTTAFDAPTVATAQDHSSTADDIFVTSEITVTVGDTPAAGGLVIFQVSRDVSVGGDDLDIDARLHGIRIHYIINTGTDD